MSRSDRFSTGGVIEDDPQVRSVFGLSRENPSDPVNHPAHYKTEGGIECIDAIRAALGPDGFVAYCRGNAIKYAWRAGKKGSTGEDMAKAAKYAGWASEGTQ